jgi:hypothetical protein
MAEADLYAPVKRFLEGQGYAVKGEVRDCDLVAIRGDEAPVIVELKTAFSLALLMQGVDRQAMSDAVYLAFGPPKRRQQRDIIKLCRRLGLGVLIVTGEIVEAYADPLPYKPKQDKRRATLLLKEFSRRVGDPNVGGTTRRPRMTAYRQDALRLVGLLGREGEMQVADLRTGAGVAKAATMLQSDVYGWFQRVARGRYTLSEKGLAASRDYAETIPALLPQPVTA